MDKLKRFFEVANRIRFGTASEDDLKFYYEYAPEIDQAKVDKFLDSEDGLKMDFEDANAAFIEVGQALQSDPKYKDMTLKIGREAESTKLGEKIAGGINLILAGSDIAQSINQIRAANKGAKESKRPTRPTIPQRDAALQQALRGAQVDVSSQENAIAPVKAQIQDQYLNDIANAKTASTGQAGAYGSYAQLAANRRNRAAMQLAPIADQIKRQDQARADQLLGMRADETQQMFQNQATLYPADLQQYQLDQQAAAQLGSTGRSNLRNSLYNFGSQVAPQAADYYTQRKYRNLHNNVAASLGETAADIAEKNQQYLDEQYYGYNRMKPELNYSDIYEPRSRYE
jgi:hypothetical protein